MLRLTGLPFATCVTIDHRGGLQRAQLAVRPPVARDAGTRTNRRMADDDDALAVSDADDAFAMHLGVMGSKLSFSERLKQARQLEALLEAFSDDPDDSGAPLLASAQATLHPPLGHKLDPR